MLRVAAFQFVVHPDADANLTSCLALIARAAREHGAQLIVLPEFTNHGPVLDDNTRAEGVAVTLDGPFLSALRAACSEHKVHLVVGVSLLSDQQVTSSGLLFSPDGSLLTRSDRQTFSGDLSRCHSAGPSSAQVVETEIGQLGLCVGSDAACMETIRSLAVAGAQLVCALFGPDAARDISVHLAARAVESRVFVVGAAALSYGASGAEPQASLQAEAPSSECEQEDWGCSQIVAPDGTVLAKGSSADAGLVLAELTLADTTDKVRADGTDILALRRPELYRPLLPNPASLGRGAARFDRSRADGSRERSSATRGTERFDNQPTDNADRLELAVVSSVDAGSIEGAIESAAGFVRELAQQGVQLVVLPELFCFEHGLVDDPAAAADWFQPAARRLAEACANTPAQVATSLVERTATGFAHVGVVIGHAGVVARAGQLHVPARHAWATPARRFELLPLPWARVGLLVGEDASVPEAARALALLGAELLLAALGSSDSPAAVVQLRAAALENNLPVAAAIRQTEAGGGILLDPERGAEGERAAHDQAILRGRVRCGQPRLGLLERPYRPVPGMPAQHDSSNV